MRRVWAGIGQAIESAAIAAIGLVVVALVLLAVWGVDQGFEGDPLLQWRVAVDAWMLGHGVDVGVTLATDAVVAVGIEEASRSFVLGIGAWGIGLVTLWLHWRAGRRLAELPAVDAGIATAAGAIATGLVGLAAGASAQHATAAPDLGQAFALPALVALAGMAGAVLARRGHEWVVASGRALTVDEPWVRAARAALRAGLASTIGVLGVGALLLGAGLLLRFTDAILLLESLEPTGLGVVVLFLVQLALAPTAVVWASSWAIGPGFELGTGSSVSPLGTELGPVPSLPLLAAIDPSAQPWMLAVVALPVLAGVAAGVLARQTVLAGTRERPAHWWELAAAAAGGALVAGMLLGVLAALSAGAIGPGRLADAGPDAVLVAAWGALEVGVGLAVGLFAGARVGGPIAVGEALPLATEGSATSVRGVLGLGGAGRGRGTGDDPDPDDLDDEDSRPDAGDEHDGEERGRRTEGAEPAADDPDAQVTEAVEPVVVERAADARQTEAVGPVEPAAGERATDRGEVEAADDERDEPRPSDGGRAADTADDGLAADTAADREPGGDRAPR
ncbi:cell division protein PerM [Agrococcus terreus]|uniref:cell division protein PerM n=1 Tax=Agrococcus terreus TaxID=574649 RepID=UPI00166CFB66|nr:DUF6350 family protein [Agrococcus terreus]